MKTKEKLNNPKPKNLHGGHRQRLKERVRKGGFDILEDHEKLELLLTYSIPYKDTNGLAHNLLDIYGSFDKVIDADYYDMLNIKGIGKETAMFFKVIAGTMDTYFQSKSSRTTIFLKSSAMAVAYFRKHFSIKEQEYFYIFALNKSRKLIYSLSIKGSDDSSIQLNLKQITDILIMNNVSSIIIIHTHPNGDPTPTIADIDATEKIYKACLSLGVNLEDHIIVSDAKDYSLLHNRDLEAISKKYEILNTSNKKTSYTINNNTYHKNIDPAARLIPIDED